MNILILNFVQMWLHYIILKIFFYYMPHFMNKINK